MVKFVCIEGNVGSGKSALLQSLKRDGNCVVTYPVQHWSMWLGKSHDPQFFQCLVLAWYISVANTHAHKRTKLVYIERSPLSNSRLFTSQVFTPGRRMHALYRRLLARAMNLYSGSEYIFLVHGATPTQCKNELERRGAGMCIDVLRAYDIINWNTIVMLRQQRRCVNLL